MYIKESHEYKKVVMENIVFLQGDDYLQYESDNPSSDIDYLLQWYNPGEHNISVDFAADINTAFLGNLIKINGYRGYFLFSKNSRIGYMGLSRIVGLES